MFREMYKKKFYNCVLNIVTYSVGNIVINAKFQQAEKPQYEKCQNYKQC